MPSLDEKFLSVWDQELCLLMNQQKLFSSSLPLSSGENEKSCFEMVEHILKGEYHHVLKSSFSESFLGMNSVSSSDLTGSSLENWLQSSLAFKLTNLLNDKENPDTHQLQQLKALSVGIAALNSFLQLSWTGPMLDWDPTNDLVPQELIKSSSFTKECLEYLAVDGEEAYPLIPQPILFIIAKLILVDHAHLFKDLASISWWSHRCAFTHQRLLDEPVDSLKTILDTSYDTMISNMSQRDCHDDVYARLHLEHGLTFHYYKLDKEAVKLYEKSQEASRFQWSLSGALGKRTKFQTFDVSQLVIMAESHQDDQKSEPAGGPAHQESNAPELPTTMDLNDDVLLETIEFTKSSEDDVDPSKQSKLREIDQCILLANCLNVKNTNPNDGLTTEEMFPYVRRVLENPNNWMIHTMALLLRSRLESNKSRTVERGCLQLQALVDQFGVHDSTATERMSYLFSILIPSKWEMENSLAISLMRLAHSEDQILQKENTNFIGIIVHSEARELGERLVSLGVIRSALEIFERLQMWEDVISCHQMLDQGQKAEKIVLELLEQSPNSAKLLCILADIRNNDADLYQKAWDVSNGRYARAMRSLGAHYYKKQEWQKCIDSYAKALRINTLFENSWFVQGCAAMQIENYDVAEIAFQRVTALDQENAEAWNNLASVFIKRKKLREAYQAFKVALKHSFDASNIWENYLFVCVDLGEFKEAIRAAERVFMIRIENNKMKHRSVDIPVLDVIVSAVEGNVPLANGEPASTCALDLQRLVEKMVNRMASAPLYALCARIMELNGKYRAALEQYQKAYRSLLNDPSLTEQKETFEALCTSTKELLTAFERLGTKQEAVRMGDSEQEMVCKDWLYQSRMAVKAVIGRTKQTYEGTTEFDEMMDKLASLKRL